MRSLAEWWDGVELWFTQLWFPFQVALVIAVLLPLCWAAAVLIDHGWDRASAVLSVRRRSGRQADAGDVGAAGRSGPQFDEPVEAGHLDDPPGR